MSKIQTHGIGWPTKADIDAFPKDKLTFITWGDDQSVSVYLGNVFLAHEDTHEAADQKARFVISAYDNGASWARKEFPELALQ